MSEFEESLDEFNGEGYEVSQFIEKAKMIQKMKTKYRIGNFMNRKDGDHYLTDDAGLIKGILWGYPEVGKYKNNGVPDYNANTMISNCKCVTTDFTKIKPGWLVWMEGHIGIYVGEGVVIEATAAWDSRVMRSYLRGCNLPNIHNLHERQWKKCGAYRYIKY